jgi:hypothetical protein
MPSLQHWKETAPTRSSCRQLLRRAQLAIGAILSSEACTADLLDRAAAQTALKRHEWEIASTLREITALRAESGTSLPGASPGPMTEAVLESHRRALALARQATTARVCALERYAEQVRMTDAARLDWQGALKIAGLNDRYLDLLARTAADDQAIAEITTLTEQASAADEAFREGLHRATIAAAHPVHHRPAALQKLATWAVLMGCPGNAVQPAHVGNAGKGPPMSKPVQHAAIARSHRNDLLCAFCPSALAQPFTANIRYGGLRPGGQRSQAPSSWVVAGSAPDGCGGGEGTAGF